MAYRNQSLAEGGARYFNMPVIPSATKEPALDLSAARTSVKEALRVKPPQQGCHHEAVILSVARDLLLPLAGALLVLAEGQMQQQVIRYAQDDGTFLDWRSRLLLLALALNLRSLVTNSRSLLILAPN